jgi:transaldolase/glucose-6-phosphate isomerase
MAATKGENPLKGLLAYGQSPWLDYIRRNILLNGDLKKMIDNDGLRGMTSNPAIFEKAITAGDDYNDIIKAPDAKSSTAMALYEKIAIRDVEDAADLFRAAYQETKGRDGYVSLEVSPNLAFDTQATLDEARRLWKAVNRPNVMIKIPGTPQGIPAIRQALEEGININITLLFAQSAYEQVAEAYLAALEARAAKGQDVSQIASVASFFVSRIDSLVDSTIDAKQKMETDSAKKARLESLRGKVAIANARRTYAKYQEITGTSPLESIGGQRGADAAACCGRAPAPRIPSTATCFTWRS